jgi:hypothetical protein
MADAGAYRSPDPSEGRSSNMTKNIWRGRVSVAAIALCAYALEASGTDIERVGRAFDPDTNELLFTEHHEETLDSGRLQRSRVVYRNGDGDVFATKTLDFSGVPTQPDFRFEDSRTGYVEGAKTENDVQVLELRRGRDRDWTRLELATPEGAIFDAGLERFIEAHWDQLLAEEKFRRDFLLPGRKGFAKFKISLHDQSDPDQVTIELKLSVFLIGLFIEPIYLTFDRATHTLVEYRGISNVRDEDTKNMKVQIEFERL